MAANCVEVNPGSPFQVLRQRWGSSLLEEAELHGDPKLITIAPHVIEAREGKTCAEASLETFSPTLEDEGSSSPRYCPRRNPFGRSRLKNGFSCRGRRAGSR